MLIRSLLAITAVAAVVACYLARFPSIDERWPHLAASVAIGAVLVLLLLAGANRKARFRWSAPVFRRKLTT
jgi:hypothetical protein